MSLKLQESKKDLIHDAIDSYIKIENPGYAILITGSWGCGKTYKINEYISSHKGKKILYFSVFGVSTEDEYHNRLHLSLLPNIIRNKHTSYINKILDLLKNIKTPLADNALSLGYETLMQIIFDKTDIDIIFIDDLERSQLEINILFGLINKIINDKQVSVVLISNEDKLTDSNYRKIKEKIIGRTIRLLPDIDTYLNSILKEYELTKDIQNYIRDCLFDSGIQNIRTLKYALGDLVYFLSVLSDDHKENPKFDKDLVRFTISFSIEFHNDGIDMNQLTSMNTVLLFRDNENTGIEKQSLQSILNKYKLDKNNIPFVLEYYKDYFQNGFIDKDDFNNHLKSTRYFITEESPLWKMVWDYRNFVDFSELKEALDDLLNELIESKEINPFEIIHIVGIIIEYSEENFIEFDNIDNIISIAEEKLEKSIELINHIDYNEFPSDHWDGFMYRGLKEPKMVSFLENSKKILKSFYIDYAKEAMLKYPSDIKSNSNKALSLLYSHDFRFQGQPILSYMDLKQFVNTILSMHHNTIYELSNALMLRYDENRISDIDIGTLELESLKELRSYLLDDKLEIDKLKEKVFEDILIPSLDRCIEKIQSYWAVKYLTKQ